MNKEKLTLNLCKLAYIVTNQDNRKVLKKYISVYGKDLTNDKNVFDMFAFKLNQDEFSYVELYDTLDFALNHLKPGLNLMQVLMATQSTKQYHSFLDKKYQAAI